MKLGLLLTHRVTLAFFNILLTVILFITLRDSFSFVRDLSHNVEAIEDLLEGIATIFVAYGVALEERDTLMKVFKLYPAFESPAQAATDKLCHFYGLSYLLIGLFMEVIIETVKLPYRFFHTPVAEETIFIVGFLFCGAAIILLLRNSLLLLKNPPSQNA